MKGAAVVVAACLLIGLPRYKAGVLLGDEGFLAYGAERVLQGEVPHRDFFTLHPAASFYTVAAIFEVFGTSLDTLRTAGLILSIFISLGVYFVALRVVKPIPAAIAAIAAAILGMPSFLYIPFAVWQAMAVGLAAVLLRLDKRPFAAGVVAALAILLRHDQGVYLAVALLTLPERKRFLAGIAVIAAPAAAVVLAVRPMFEQLVLFPFHYAKTSSLPFPPPSSPLALLFYLVPIVDLIALKLLPQKFFPIWSLLFFLQALTRTDLSHLAVALPPFCIVVAALCDTSWKRIAAVAFLLTTIPQTLPGTAGANQPIELERARGIRTADGAGLTAMVRTIQKLVPPQRTILCLPYQPLIYFLAERRNPTHWNYIWKGDQSPADLAALIAQARRDPPQAIVVSGEENVPKEILDYIHAGYVPKFGGQIYVPRP